MSYEDAPTEQPRGATERAADLALEALTVTLARSGLVLRSAVIEVRLAHDDPDTGRDSALGATFGTDVEDPAREVVELLERGLRAARRAL